MKIDLSGKRALVTGGDTGIGRAISLAFGEAGAAVAVNYLKSVEGAEEVARTIRDGGGEAIPVQGDVSDSQRVAAMFSEAEEALGPINLLVNNAGVEGKQTPAWELDPADWRKVIEVNLFGAFYCAREALRRMVERKDGVILNITSVHEKISRGGYSPYTASKAGLSMLTRNLAQETASHGVRVVAIAPGAIKTDMNRDVWENPEGEKQLLKKIPMDRIGEPEQVASMAVALASDAASYVTGTTLFVDGGMTEYPSFEGG